MNKHQSGGFVSELKPVTLLGRMLMPLIRIVIRRDMAAVKRAVDEENFRIAYHRNFVSTTLTVMKNKTARDSMNVVSLKPRRRARRSKSEAGL